jgi:Uma2 family endonuclease
MTMAIITPQTMTLDEFLARYEHEPTLEYEQGVVTEKMASALSHGFLAGLLVHWLNGFMLPRKLGIAASELRITDQTTGVSWIPDVSVYVWDRIERDPKAQEHGAVSPPDIAIEIASPGQSRRKQIERCQEYLAIGVRIGLMLDPRARTIVDVRPGQPAWQLRSGDVLDLGGVIPGMMLAVGDLFDALRFE